MPTIPPRTIEFLRVGNPWMVGKHVDRIVPLYALQNFAAPDFERNPLTQAVKHLVIDPQKGLDAGLAGRVTIAQTDLEDLRATAKGLFSPEDRIFLDRKSGGASSLGAPFPVVGGLVSTGAGDDGIGKRIREVMDRHSSNWTMRLIKLVNPSQPRDPATSFASALLGGVPGHPKTGAQKAAGAPLAGLDLYAAEFVDKLIPDLDDAQRVPALRALAQGIYFVSIIRMVSGPCWELSERVPRVMVFGGVPPGQSDEPLVRAACDSFQSWISQSWSSTADCLWNTINAAPWLAGASTEERRRQQIQHVLQQRKIPGDDVLLALMDALDPLIKLPSHGVTWCREALEAPELGLPRQELARRVRSLGGNIGLTGPDRGVGSPRLVFDTPLLGVLVKGIVGTGSMEFREFVSQLTRSFGLVVGLGRDDSVVAEIALIGSGGYDAYEILERNQELFRERLLRTGLARSFSDSHTEVLCNG